MSSTATLTTHIWRPSNARYLAIDGFVPVPRGTLPGVPAPLSWPAKDPADVLDYQFDVGAALVGNPGDAIAELTAAVTPTGIGDLLIDSTAAEGALAVIWFSAGNVGTVYTVVISLTTLSGRIMARSVLLPVLSLTSAVPPLSSLTTDQGVVITDQNGNPILLGS